MTSNQLLLYRLAELMLEYEQHILPVDLLFDDERIGDFVKSIQIDSPYQQMVLEGVLTESVRDEKLFVSFTVEGYFHYVLGEVIYNQSREKSPEALKQIVEVNKLNGAKEGVEQCLIREVLVDDLSRLMWLIDEGEEMLELCIIPLLNSLKSQGTKKIIEKLLVNPTENDWKALLELEIELSRLDLYILRREFLKELIFKNKLQTNESLLLSIKTIAILDKEEAITYLSKTDILANLIQDNSNLLFHLGRCESNFENYDKALIYYEKSLIIEIKTIGENHSNIATTYSEIGYVWKKKGDYDKALEFYEKSLYIKLKTLGENHDSISTSYNNIGLVWDKKGNYDKALEFYEKSLSIKLKTIGENHSASASTFNNLGLVWQRKGNYDKALEYYEKSLTIKLKTLGDNDNLVAITYNSMGLAHQSKGNFDESLKYYEKSLAINKKTLGKNHSSVAITNQAIGLAFYSKGNYKKSLEFLQKSLAIDLRKMHENHPDLAHQHFDIANCKFKLKKYFLAIENYNKAYNTLKKGGIPFKIAECYEYLNNPIEAIEYYIQSAEIRKEDIGFESDATQEAIANAKRLAKELGKEHDLPEWMN